MTDSSEVLDVVRESLDTLRGPRNRKLLVALSGGVDSQALTHALAKIAPERELGLCAVHVDHGIRPGSADDARRVKDFCARIGVDCVVEKVDVEAWERALKQGTEAAARAARYAALTSAAADAGTDCVATGHTLDDQAETILLRLISGAGLEGLGGMNRVIRRSVLIDPKRKRNRRLSIVRPFLFLQRSQIEAYACAHNLEPIEDESNLSLAFRRNAIRHRVLPALIEIEASAPRSISRTAELLRDDARFIGDAVDVEFESIVAERGGVWMIERQQFKQTHLAIQRRILYRAMEPLLPPSARLTQERIEAVREAAVDGRPGAVIELPDGYAAYIDYDRVAIGDASTLEDDLRSLSWIPLIDRAAEIALDGDVDVKLQNGWRVRGFAAPEVGLVLRTRREGDRTRVKRNRGRVVKLQDWFVDRKVPQYVRDQLPLVERNGEIEWIIGLDITEYRDPAIDVDLHVELDTSGPLVPSLE